MKKFLIYVILSAIISCDSVEEKKVVLNTVVPTDSNPNDEVLENIYYSIPSPIETTAAMLAVGSDRLKPGTDVYLCASQKIEVDKVAGTGETAVGSERPKVDSDRFNSVNERHNRDPELNIMDYSENACPPVTLPAQYIQDCKDLGIFQSLPSQASGKDSAQFHASDLRFLLNEASQRQDLIPLLVHYLGSEQVARQYLEFIF